MYTKNDYKNYNSICLNISIWFIMHCSWVLVQSYMKIKANFNVLFLLNAGGRLEKLFISLFFLFCRKTTFMKLILITSATVCGLRGKWYCRNCRWLNALFNIAFKKWKRVISLLRSILIFEDYQRFFFLQKLLYTF
jgi:hypothetical protein